MRRILALAAVSGLALTGLTGTPAAADSTIQDVADVVINEAGVDVTDPVNNVTDINYVEIHNTTVNSVDVSLWTIRSCATNGAVLGETVLLSSTIIPAGGFRLAGDDKYALSDFDTSAPRDFELDGTNGDGLDNLGGVAFLNPSDVADHSVVFDSSPSMALLTCLQSGVFTPEVSPSPNDPDLSAERSVSGSGVVSWSLDDPTPRAAN